METENIVLCHGDLKPSNVMVEEGEKSVKLIDFELSGVGWRGFDLYKMFRTGGEGREENMEVRWCFRSFVIHNLSLFYTVAL